MWLFWVYQVDYNAHQLNLYKLKFAAQEAAASGAQMLDLTSYSNGYIVFNSVGVYDAVKQSLIENLNLDTDLSFKSNSYWQGTCLVNIQIYNYNNIPNYYYDVETNFGRSITVPSVVVKVDAGGSRYRLPYINNSKKSIKIGIHEWRPRS